MCVWWKEGESIQLKIKEKEHHKANVHSTMIYLGDDDKLSVIRVLAVCSLELARCYYYT